MKTSYSPVVSLLRAWHPHRTFYAREHTSLFNHSSDVGLDCNFFFDLSCLSFPDLSFGLALIRLFPCLISSMLSFLIPLQRGHNRSINQPPPPSKSEFALCHPSKSEPLGNASRDIHSFSIIFLFYLSTHRCAQYWYDLSVHAVPVLAV